jgi:hypothetical protein
MAPSLDRLSSGTLDWLAGHLDHFDPYSPRAASATHGTVKAVLELALLRHLWARSAARDDRLDAMTALVRGLWRSPDFERFIAAQPDFAPRYGLVYAALAPPGTAGGPRRTTLARAAAEEFAAQSPYQRLETRYYADLAGIDHGIEPYEELLEQSPLVKPATGTSSDGAPLTTQDAYALTHSAFFLSDFGRRSPGPATALVRATDVAGRMLDHCVRHDRWDLTAELLITRYCLGHHPLDEPSGAAAVQCLARAQRADGAIPARSADLRAAGHLPAAESFRKAYHTTLVTALMSLIVT